MARLPHAAIMHKVLVQLRLLQLAIIVLVNKLVDRNPVLFRVRLQDVRKVTRLGLGRDPLSARSIPRQPGFRVQRRFPHPIRMVLLDRRPNRAFEPLDMLLLHLAWHLVVDLQREIRHERRLGSREVVRSVPVEDLAVVLDLKDEVFDVVHRHLVLAVDEEAEAGKVRVPVVELAQASAERNMAPRGNLTSLNRAPGTTNGKPSNVVFPSAVCFFFIARAKIPGTSFNDLTNSGSSGCGGSTSTCSPSWGFFLALPIRSAVDGSCNEKSEPTPLDNTRPFRAPHAAHRSTASHAYSCSSDPHRSAPSHRHQSCASTSSKRNS